jgi:hypothetical protein
VYSQHYILNTLTEIQLIIGSIQPGGTTDPSRVLKEWQYKQQINLWRNNTAKNEKTKYEAIDERKFIKKHFKCKFYFFRCIY